MIRRVNRKGFAGPVTATIASTADKLPRRQNLQYLPNLEPLGSAMRGRLDRFSRNTGGRARTDTALTGHRILSPRTVVRVRPVLS
jgi:hypothetical protein